MTCKICQSSKVEKIDDFKPYIDKDWNFEIYNCLDCHTRFALRNNSIDYHEEMHKTANSPYKFHYETAQEIKHLLSNDLKACETILSKKSPVLQDLFTYLKCNRNQNLSILEIGCSTGYITAYLQKIGYQDSLGIDISSSAITYAQSAFGDYYALQEEPGKNYDVIFHTGLIGCVDNPIKFLNHYLNLLSDGGIMFFNAPNVDSVKETNELWVSTPPPDLVYLFKDNIFERVLNGKYALNVTKTLSPLRILKKYVNKFNKSKNNTYPRNFVSPEISNIKPVNIYVKKMLYITIKILVKIKLLKHYSDDYGLIYQIKKIKSL